MPTPKKRTISPIKVKEPKDLPKVELPPLEIKPVDVTKPPPPDVSTGAWEEAWAFVRSIMQKTIKEGGVSINKLVEFPNTLYKLGLVVFAVIVVVGIPAILMKGC